MIFIIDMANVIATIRIMPVSPEVDLSAVLKKAGEIIGKKAEYIKHEIEPVAFGIKALMLYVKADESKGSLDPLCEEIQSKIKEVQGAEVIDVRREIEL